MYKLFFSLLFTIVSIAGFAQRTQPTQAPAAIAVEMKTALVEKLQITEESAAKIIAVEESFYTKLSEIEAAGPLPLKDKEIKLNEAHTARRLALMATPLTGRQMEDAIEVVAAVRRKYKR